MLLSLYFGMASCVSCPLGNIGKPSLSTHFFDINETFAPVSRVTLSDMPLIEALRAKCGRGLITERNGRKQFSAFVFDWIILGAEALTPPNLADEPAASQEVALLAPTWSASLIPSPWLACSSSSQSSSAISSLRRQ